MKIQKLILLLPMIIFVSLSANAQNARLQVDHLDRLFPKAVETIDVSVESSLLQIASKFLKSDKADEAAVRELLSALKGVYVKGVEFDNAGEYNEADIETVRQQLRSPGWERIVGVKSRRDGDNVEVYMMLNGGVIAGIGVLIFDPRQLMIVNVVGPIDPEKISQLRGHFGIPGDLDFDWGGSRRSRN